MDGTQLQVALAAFHDAVSIAGGQAPFSRETGISQQRVSYRLRKRLPLPSEFVIRTEEATGVSRFRLRPDIYPPSSAEPSPENAPLPVSVDDGAPIVACDRSAISHRSAQA